MSRIWITSDLHIGHNRDFVFQNRGFNNIEEHDKKLVINWNELVAPDDVVYILGDVMLKHDLQDDQFSYGLSILQQLNGKLIIIRGNHDSLGKIERYKTCKNVVQAGDAALYLDYPDTGRYHFYLTHYPTLVSHKNLKPVKSALINIYGHTHQNEHFQKRFFWSIFVYSLKLYFKYNFLIHQKIFPVQHLSVQHAFLQFILLIVQFQ